ncbi:thioredoxin family protein [Actinophytocola xanthii]|uniref:Thioredoxin family protein n=1 Tax=Actinophytocola xanthii TaxID=1912961 RepID=A0A1Q8BVF0_9PSEU|nr:thioredoxin family protein [Actinophytocola xanthii]OLF06086.1 thioredoxin family protein [Actinophytocola xanthii]
MVAVNSAMVPLGTEAPPFELPAPDGTTWTLDSVAGPRGTLVAFLCNHCPFVRHIAVPFGAAAARWRAQGLGVIGINSNDSDAYPDELPERMAEQATTWRWSFPYVSDPEQTTALAYRAACTPDFFLFDPTRRLVYRGRFDAARPNNGVPVTGDELEAAVASVIAGEEIEIGQLPSIGCNIKWKPETQPRKIT